MSRETIRRGALAVCLALLLVVSSAPPSIAGTPVIANTEPSRGFTDEDTEVILTGDGFETGARVGLLDGGPYAVGWVNTDKQEGVAVSGNYAYLAGGGALKIIDVSDPASPFPVGTAYLPGWGWAKGVAVSGDYAYVGMIFGGFHIVDVSDPTQPSVVGSIATPGGYDIALSGNLAYVAVGFDGLWVIDVSDPTLPVFVGNWDTSDRARGVALAGKYAYLAVCSDGLEVIDISDPTSPVLVGFVDTPRYAEELAVHGDHVFVADAHNGLQSIDVSDPTSPVLSGASGAMGRSYDVAIAVPYAFVADSTNVSVIDISDLDTPILVEVVPARQRITKIAVSGGYAYTAEADGFEVFDISHPVPPQPAGSLATVGGARAVTLAGGYAYVAERGLQVVDIGLPTQPTPVGSAYDPRDSYEVAVDGHHAYVVSNTGLTVYDTSNPSNPGFVGVGGTPGRAVDVAVATGSWWIESRAWGSSAVASSQYDDPDWGAIQATGPPDVQGCADVHRAWAPLSDGADPEWLEVLFAEPEPAEGIDIHENHIGGFVYKVELIDTDGLRHTIWTGTDDTPCPGVLSLRWPVTPYDVRGARIHTQVDGWEEIDAVARIGSSRYVERVAFVADHYAGLQVLDVGDLSHPEIVGGAATPQYAMGVAISGSHAFVAAHQDGLAVMDISDVGSPYQVAGVGTSDDAQDVALRGNLAYVATLLGLDVVDISDPRNPIPIGHVSFGTAYEVTVFGDYAYLAGGSKGLRVIDVSDPTRPVWIGNAVTPGWTYDSTVDGEYAYVAAGSGGLQVIRLNPPITDIQVAPLHEIDSTVPTGFTPGPYNVLVTNPGGERGMLRNGYVVCARRPFSGQLLPQYHPDASSVSPDALPWRLVLEGDGQFFEPTPHHEAILALPELPADLETEHRPGDGTGTVVIELRLDPRFDTGTVLLIGDDPGEVDALWNAALGAGGFGLPRYDARSYGDAILHLDRTPWTGTGAPVRYRYDFAEGQLTRALGRASDADLVVEVAATDHSDCETRISVDFAQTRVDLCRDYMEEHPELAALCED
jgi:hypothetical protein